jgi:hypothetical protein
MYGSEFKWLARFPGFDNLGDNAFNQYKWEGQVSLWKYLRSFKLSYQFG